MIKSLKMAKSFILLIIILPIMTVISIILYYEYINTKNDVFSILKTYLVNEKIKLFENYSKYITHKLGEHPEISIAHDKIPYSHYEKELQLIQGNDIEYLYLLYRDKQNKFRYLLDATTNPDDKALFNQKFDPQTDIWDKVYSTKKFQMTKQSDLDSLWITVAYPVILDKQVVAVIGADFTYKVYNKIVNTFKPMEKVHQYVSFFMVAMLIIAYILIYLFYVNRKRSFIDPLTKIYNRQYLYEFLKTTSMQHYQLMMVDLDHFKQINDTYGHDVGDIVLIDVVQKMKSHIRNNDILIRFGGEEFIILVHKQKLQDCLIVAKRIKDSVMHSKIITPNNQEIQITISMGINPFPYYAKNFDEAIKIADEQLYNAKNSGRNTIKVSENINKNQSLTSKRIGDVKQALEDGRIKCAYQDIYSMKEKKTLKYEMLLRLIDVDGKVVFPLEFLPSIKFTNIYIEVTKFVVDNAIRVLKEHDFELSINLDLQDIMNDDILNLLQERFFNNKELAKRLSIEILEHEEITDFASVEEKINLLKDIGFQIALDDFGSGYANFTYLLQLNIDKLKIDANLIVDIDKNKKAYYMVESISAFAKKTNIKTIAEHVETKEEFELLQKLGIDYIQGYYIAKPDFLF